MMPAAFFPVLPAMQTSTVEVVFAAKTRPEFVREVSEGTRYVAKSVAAHPPFPGTFSCHLVLCMKEKETKEPGAGEGDVDGRVQSNAQRSMYMCLCVRNKS